MSEKIDFKFYAFVVGVAFLVVKLTFSKKKFCPSCNAPLSKLRKPTNIKEVFWGGYTCKKCSAKINVNFLGKIKTFKMPKKRL